MINIKNPVVRGSIILLILFAAFNAFNFLYHIFMARNLSIEDYGALKTLFFFLYIGGILMESLQTVVTKYSSTQKDKGNLKWLFTNYVKKLTPVILVLFLIYVFSSIFLSPLLKINKTILIFNGLFFLGAIFSPVARGILQGQKRFFSLGFSFLSESILKLITALILVNLGFGLFGAVSGAILAIFISIFISLFFLRDILSENQKPYLISGIKDYGFPVLIATTSIIIFFNVDVFLARVFFSEQLNGLYSIASTIALIIFLGTQPISKALFPVTAGEENNKKDRRRHLSKAILLLSTCILFALVIIKIFPDEIINLFSNKNLPEIKNIVFILALGNSFLSLTNLVIFYKLSIGKTKGCFFLPVFIIIQIILLYIFSDSLFSFSIAYLSASIIFLIGSLLALRR